MRDEILEAVVRDELRELGMCEYEVDDALATMRDQGMFGVPDWDAVVTLTETLSEENDTDPDPRSDWHEPAR